MKILVCGGAGYIGSHVVKVLIEKHYEVVVLDNLSTGHLKAIPAAASFEKADIGDLEALNRIFSKHQIDGVMHFCANSLVAESMEKPILYYENNVAGTLNLLKAMVQNNVLKFIFSSTAAVYGEPEILPIIEETKKNPTNTYGATKLAVENMLPWFEGAYGLKYMVFRYFNAAGASSSSEIGEDHTPETHLIPLVLKTALGQREKISIFGTDYETDDGSCIRDYIHVLDIASAHILGMESLFSGKKSNIFNLGQGHGFSVREIIEKSQELTQLEFAVEEGPRRAGDPAILIAESNKAKTELGWQPLYSDIETIIKTAWEWHKSHPQGYED
ncbi:MAG: UDP-glucose 4-epimerase [Eubacteriaceae bacterium]|nr:UDP-glucose 4-epimerase [Eubacteriaceae bacterium]MDK2935923.1 UDP-glucose 4-epimerase [Eubacteriaceae bacterium]